MSKILLIFVTTVSVFAPSASQASEITPLLNQLKTLAAAVDSKETHDDALISKIMDLWQTNCAKSQDERCALLEADVFPGGAKDRILLFRGENGLFEYPGTSPAIRDLLNGSRMCKDPCDLQGFADKEMELLDYVSTHESFTLEHRFFRTVVFDQRDMTWKEDSGSPIEKDGLPVLSPLVPPGPKQEKVTALNLLATNHIAGYGLETISVGGKLTKEFNPFVSLSTNPKVAVFFSQKGTAPQDQMGRIFILSVKKSDVPTESKCDGPLPSPGGLILLGECSDGAESYDEEGEIDAVNTLDPATIKTVLETPVSLRRVDRLN